VPSFTLRLANLRQFGPVVELQVSVPLSLERVLRSSNQAVPPPVTVQAMIDTGASSSVIRDDIPTALGLNPVGVVSVKTPSSAGLQYPQYALRLQFPNRVSSEVTAVAAPLPGQHFECLIGRDLLTHAVLIYTGHDGSFTLSF
jgi:hypothetical protein